MTIQYAQYQEIDNPPSFEQGVDFELQPFTVYCIDYKDTSNTTNMTIIADDDTSYSASVGRMLVKTKQCTKIRIDDMTNVCFREVVKYEPNVPPDGGGGWISPDNPYDGEGGYDGEHGGGY